jgi:dTMP kinase
LSQPERERGRGRFIAFEGGEACGKSTQARLLADALGAVLTREPGGTPLGERVRALLLDPASGDIDGRAEALLVAAARAQHVRDVISPALAAGRDVVTDRFSGSSIAYQGYGRGVAVDEVRSLSTFASDGLWPDLTVLLVVSAPLGVIGSPDRFEAAGDQFHARVEEGFLHQAADDPEGWVVINGEGTELEVAKRVLDVVLRRVP